MFNPDFYPTPKSLIEKMISGIDFMAVETMLEPSAGKGDILDELVSAYKSSRWRNRRDEPDVDAIEIVPELRHILSGKGYRVVHDDFLNYESFKRYDLIVMNPPFSEGDKHLAKALEMQRNGGMVVCLLNAETLKNPYSMIRKTLLAKLEELEADIEYIPDAFKDAERRTGVEVALVKVFIKQANQDGVILSGLRKEQEVKAEQKYENQITSGDFIQSIVERYNFEIAAGVRLLEEYFSMKPLVLDSFDKGQYPRPILQMVVQGVERDYNTEHLDGSVNHYVKRVRYKYWSQLFQSKQFMELLTSELQQELMARVHELANYDFSAFNITEIKMSLSSGLMSGVEAAIIDLFDEFSSRHHWTEYSKNVHYYNGWKTNQAWFINKRVIIPLNAYGWGGYDPDYRTKRKLMDIEKVFDYLDGGRTDHHDLHTTLERAKQTGQTKKVQLKYFKVTFYKKGTCHIEFTDLDLLKKFNLFGSQKKNWLPPGYGRKAYEEMTQEEQGVVDSFEGKESYVKTTKNQNFFLSGNYNLPMLETGTGGA